MICRKIGRKNPWSMNQLLRCIYSATATPSGAAAKRASSEVGLLSRAQAHIFTNPRTLISLKNHLNRDSLLGIKGGCCSFTSEALADHLPVVSGGMVDVPLAQTGEGIAECELLKWFVQEGDEVEEFQPLCEVQSDKATIEITSRYRGKVSKLLHVPGNIVKVGETLLKMAVDEIELQQNQQIESSETIISELVDIVDSLKEWKTGGVQSTPAVRNFAKQLGVDVEHVHGSGKEGRVLKEDILKYATEKGIFKESTQSFSAPSGDEKFQDVVSSTYDGWEYEDKTLPLRGFQRAMVKSMSLAAKIPHFHYVEEMNCNALVELKTSFQKDHTDPNVKFTFLPLLIKSLSMALTKYPLLNSCFTQELQEVILKGSHNIGIAMATPNGLVVPNIKKVQSLSILEITKEVSRLQQLALENKLSPNDITGGTITLSNIGAIGGKFGSPLINVPEVSIIAMGRIQRIPRFDEHGNVYSASIMTVNIGADHRVLDGATVARFCNEWKLFIEKPELLMLHMT
ncbi:hypothetical protein ACJIZ3_018153 [Penstemon smallii]|uniref:Dihydrolipoamide acetyltransferase component of pyruvate dehydrogenase complex n=1 Tax=Penstemon smallii TaxID=265156 RepID=A0ABD3SY53_9LAMI